ncbi:hypothetical protein PG993_013705 [Apiospora rasikravindrae]|uniref:Ankyrin repeat protein n=1 Tax=Apiospora rasikravindrae TaxID=990691 RepID=A0ABR1RQZ0_9PEZI
MEVIGSITAVISLFESAWKAKRLWDDFKDARKEIEKIDRQCQVVEHLLKGLEAFLKDHLKSLQSDKSATLHHNLAMLEIVLKNLTDALKETQEEIAKVSRKNGFDRPRFLLKKESSFVPLQEVMKNSQDSITLVMTFLLSHFVNEGNNRPRMSMDTHTPEKSLPAARNSAKGTTKTPEDLKEALRVTLEAGKSESLGLLLEEGASAECILNDKGDRPLHYVARKGDLRCLHVLLDHHVLVDEPNVNNATPLVAALDNHQVETSLALLTAGASSRMPTRKGKTPLHYAAWGNLLKPVERLLAAGADVNARDAEGKTPLHMAVQPVKNGKSLSLDSRVLEVLLKHGADPTKAVHKTSLTPLHILAEAGKSGELERLAKKSKTTDVFLAASHELTGATPLLLAAYYGNHVSVQKLLECGADPNASSPVDTRLPTALWAAFDQKKYGSARKLLEQGADPNHRLSKKFEGISLLHHAASIGDTKALERLLKYKASVDIQSSQRDTPLITAVNANQAEAAKLLVDNGANLETTYKHYNNATALIHAAKAGSLPMLHLLCRSGANWGHRTSGDNMSAFLQSVCLGHVDCAIYLLALGADVNEEGAVGWQPLHYAAARGRTEVVRWLLSMGADRSAKTGSAETAHALARENRHHEVVALLAPI